VPGFRSRHLHLFKGKGTLRQLTQIKKNINSENIMKVTYNADVCTHAGECVKGAPNVFKVVDGQFVIDTAADSEENVRATVGNCPSGALVIEE